MPAKVVVLGLDAMEATLVERWAEDGSLPTFAELLRASAGYRLSNPIETFPDVVWPEIFTGRSGASIGFYWHPGQVHAGEARLRPLRPGDVDLTAVWDHASRAGRSVAVLDVPLTQPSPGLSGVLLREWGTHEWGFGAGSDPPGFLDEIRARYGEHPVRHGDGYSSCDRHGDRIDAFERLRSGLIAGIELRSRIVRDVLDGDDWDFFFAVFTESHCAGQQFWHFFDESSPWHDPPVPASLERAIPDVYAALDAAVAHVLAGAGPETTALVLLSHGIGPNVGGHQLLPEVLVRLGYGSGRGAASKVRGRLPEPVKRVVRAAVRGGARRRLQAAAGSLPHPLESAATRAAATLNSPCGAIRLNVKGRDPFGSVEPGAEYDAVCEDLVRELEALENADTGTPAVASVVRTDALYADVHPNSPDLIVRFRREHPIVSVRSPRIGVVSRPYRTPALPRSGDHTPHARVWARGPGIAGGETGVAGSVRDITPTVLRLLDVPLPRGLEGSPLPLAARALA